ncbi:divergent polysaccharide deacetylase family protein [Roseomonas elaeocarpi]|uniref:Divergent polysaccharide deacetylase family protein n=1 Tax=Roseomonas elaeocarpi TaxID=907779 RepID=A0ABV6JYH9_9PROT
MSDPGLVADGSAPPGAGTTQSASAETPRPQGAPAAATPAATIPDAPATAAPVAPAPVAASPQPFVVPPITPPDPALQEASRHGPLPKTGADGRTAIRTYARAFPRDETRPRVAVVLGNIGLNNALSESAIRRLPPAVTLAFSPYATRIAPLADTARQRGMEMLVALPLEPAGYPLDDPGPKALLTTLSAAENADRLMWAMARLQGYVGAVGALGSMRGERFAQSPELLGGVQDVLRNRGLLYVDPRPTAAPAGRAARAWGRTVDVVLDEPATRAGIERRFQELEQVARERGAALGIAGDPTPALVERLSAWAAGLEERGLVLAPVTAMLRRPDRGADPAAGPGPVAGAAVSETPRENAAR